MNLVILHGRVARDPEIRTTSGGKRFCRFPLAVDRYTRGADKKADFINCVAWEHTADFIEKYFSKGREMILHGRIQTGSYEKDGQRQYTTDVVVENVEFCGSGNGAKKSADQGVDYATDEPIPF